MSETLHEQMIRMGLATQERADIARERKKAPSNHGKRDRSDNPSATPNKKATPGKARRRPDNAAARKRTQPPSTDKPPTRGPSAKVQAAADAAALAAERRVVKAQIKALIEANSVADFTGEIVFYYQIGERIRQLLLKPEPRERVLSGELAITRLNRVTHLIPTPIAEQVLALNPQWLVVRHTPGMAEPTPSDDPYANYEIPDDMVW